MCIEQPVFADFFFLPLCSYLTVVIPVGLSGSPPHLHKIFRFLEDSNNDPLSVKSRITI